MRDKFTFFRSYGEALENLPDDERLMCYDAIYRYAIFGEEPKLDGIAKGFFTLMKPNIDKSIKRADSGKLGGEADTNENQTESKRQANCKQNESKPEVNNNQTESEEEANFQNLASDKDKDKEEDKEEDKKKEKEKEKTKKANDLFEHLWKLYPRKEGKGSVSDTQKKRLLSIGKEHMERCIARFNAAKANTDKDYLPYGSTFFNSGYVDYLDENYEQDYPPQRVRDSKWQ